MHRFDFAAPSSLQDVFALLEQHGDDARLVAGGTALIIMMKQGLLRPELLVSMGRVPGLNGIEAMALPPPSLPSSIEGATGASPNGGLRIGALATHYEVETSPLVRERCPVLSETLHHVATVRIRNVGTLGGNLAHADPNQDPPVTLIALDASVELASAAGDRVIPVEELFTDYYETVLRPGEMLRAIRVPGLPPRSVAVYRKFLPRTADDYATVAVAARLTFDPSGERCEDVRLALGSVGSTPIRARRAEAVLRGQPLTEDAIRAAAAIVPSEVDPLDDIRGSADYKRDMAEVWTRRALTQAIETRRRQST
jgi:carbon-monoxide dehydrogenase medium subunit